jgi:polyphenol oxidase
MDPIPTAETTVPVLEARSLSAHAVHGFSTRAGGVSREAFASLNLGQGVGDDPEAVSENLRRLSRRAGGTPFTVTQVHGTQVIEVDGNSDPAAVAPTEADALVTATPGLLIAVRTADCVPLLLAAPSEGVVCAVHAGWRGTVARIAGIAVAHLESRFGVRPSTLVGAVGPAIRRCCFEVGEEVAEAFSGDLGPAVHRGPGRPHIDLVAANRLVLEAAGVPRSAVEDLNACTACDPARFFSHRRDRGRTGRHLSYIGLREPGGGWGGEGPLP